MTFKLDNYNLLLYEHVDSNLKNKFETLCKDDNFFDKIFAVYNKDIFDFFLSFAYRILLDKSESIMFFAHKIIDKRHFSKYLIFLNQINHFMCILSDGISNKIHLKKIFIPDSSFIKNAQFSDKTFMTVSMATNMLGFVIAQSRKYSPFITFDLKIQKVINMYYNNWNAMCEYMFFEINNLYITSSESDKKHIMDAFSDCIKFQLENSVKYETYFASLPPKENNNISSGNRSILC